MSFREHFSKRQISLCIILLFSGVIIAMFYLPIQFGSYRLDLRLIPLIFLALLRGWKITLPVLTIVSFWRFFMGGDGAIPGIIFGMILPTLFTLSFYKPDKARSHLIGRMILISVCWFISDFPIIFILPNGLEIFMDIFWIRYLSFLGTAVIFYLFILLEHKREALKQQLEFLACHDPLTKLLNKNKFTQLVEESLLEVNKTHSISMIDIDHFKQLNDKYGHIAGDQVLMMLARIFKKYENENIKIARYGGEEFILYQRTACFEEAKKLIEEIQNEIRTTLFKIDKNQSIKVSVSIGLAEIEKNTKLEEAIKLADRNLYKAKENGRNQLVVL
ncbi:diguanylate cyclase [Robertmurraya andreesenii]|nr:diguanylate cyclase [Robertmurraya andreesenii]